MATPGKLAQEKLVDPAIGKLLDDLRSYEDSLPYDSDDASLIRVSRRTFEQAVNIPPSFVADFTNHEGIGVSEAIVQKQGKDRIVVQIPGIQDPERARQIIKDQAFLEF